MGIYIYIHIHLFICTLYYHLTHMVPHTHEHELCVCVRAFFSDAVINSDCIPSNDRILMNGELERSFTRYVLHK
jgi:hypothetical protein